MAFNSNERQRKGSYIICISWLKFAKRSLIIPVLQEVRMSKSLRLISTGKLACIYAKTSGNRSGGYTQVTAASQKLQDLTFEKVYDLTCWSIDLVIPDSRLSFKAFGQQ